MIIKQDKKHTLSMCLAVFISLALFTFFAVFDVRDFTSESSIFDNVVFYWVYRGLCILFLPILFYAQVWSILQLFSKKPLLEINEYALIDYSSSSSIGEIPWDSMKRVFVKGRFIVIELNNPEEILPKWGIVKRTFAKINKKVGYDYICISVERFKKQAFDVLCKIHEKKPLDGFDDIKLQIENARNNHF